MSQDGSSRSAEAPATPARTEPGGTPEVVGPSGGRRSWLWAIVFVGLAIGKAHAVAEVVRHRPELITVLGVTLALAVLRIRLILVAMSAAALFAVCVDPHPLLRGIALGAGALAVLLAVLFTLSTVLHIRQERGSTG
jgi:hypothetical protein